MSAATAAATLRAPPAPAAPTGDAATAALEASGGWRSGAWTLQGGAQWIKARRAGSIDTALNGKEPTNVPRHSLKLQARYDVATLPGLALRADLVNEGRRMVLPDNSVALPGTTRVDAGLRYLQSTPTASLIWRAGIDNLFDRRAWREAPYQFGHAYLFPLAPRTLRVSVETSL